MKKIIAVAFLFILGLTQPLNAQQEPNDSSGDIRYIRDDLFTFMHSGPGRNYRILGSIQAGTKITILQIDQDKEFAEVLDDSQRTGWVELQYITNRASMRERLPAVQAELESAQQALVQAQQQADQANQQLADVTTQNKQLQKQLDTLERDKQRVQLELDTQDQSAQMQWYTRGGITALIGIILGVIIAYLPKKRRRNDQWM